MRSSLRALKAVKVKAPAPQTTLFEFPPLASIKYTELPNTGFGINNYDINKTKFGHWPVYLKVQNTKITTEIKRIKGDLNQFKKDLKSIYPSLQITINVNSRYVNIKGDHVRKIKDAFDQYL